LDHWGKSVVERKVGGRNSYSALVCLPLLDF
jgi:hypothetical protein